MILLWGLVGDGPFDAVRTALAQCDARFQVVDQRLIRETSITLRVGAAVAGTIDVGDLQVALGDIDAVYWRTHDVRRVLARDGGSDEALLAAWQVEDAIAGWLELTDARVINRPSAMASNGSKPYQAELLRQHGFDIPPTLITTDPEAVLRFWTDHSTVIYKSISGTRSIVSRLTEAHLPRLGHITSCPTQFQQLVPGRDIRVHVVGNDLYASEVLCDADDYRYAGISGEAAQLRSTSIPEEVAQRCLAITRDLGLHLSGIDLRRAPDGRWFCFEVNPSPGFTYYEAHTGQPIADSIANLLMKPLRDPP